MKKLFIYLVFLAIGACKDAYVSPVNIPAAGYLVVEGFINSGNGSTAFTLSRVNKFTQAQTTYEQGAQVQVESDNNVIYKLVEKGKGLYEANLTLSSAQKYRLRIKTRDSKEYLSAFEAAKTTPLIDSVTWKRANDGVRIYIHTHDDMNATRYYRWDYMQTWEIHAKQLPDIKIDQRSVGGNSVYAAVFLDPVRFTIDTSRFICWVNDPSTNILLGSSAKLSKDVISLPLVFIPQGARHLSVLYSIVIRQYAVTQEAYAFYEKMKKNTELTGSIFDAQPSQLVGNIQCVSNAGEPVIGYVCVSSSDEERIFISNAQVPQWNFHMGCIERLVENISDSIKKKVIDSSLVAAVAADVASSGHINTFIATYEPCIDSGCMELK